MNIKDAIVTVQCRSEVCHPSKHFTKAVAEDILEDSKHNPWAWCKAVVTVSCGRWKASKTAPCCSFGGEAEFKEDDLYIQLLEQAFAELQKAMQDDFATLSKVLGKSAIG